VTALHSTASIQDGGDAPFIFSQDDYGVKFGLLLALLHNRGDREKSQQQSQRYATSSCSQSRDSIALRKLSVQGPTMRHKLLTAAA
jgi:hypothetical protein